MPLRKRRGMARPSFPGATDAEAPQTRPSAGPANSDSSAFVIRCVGGDWLERFPGEIAFAAHRSKANGRQKSESELVRVVTDSASGVEFGGNIHARFLNKERVVRG